MSRKKIALIGAGQIGGTLAHLIGLKELGRRRPLRHPGRHPRRQGARHRRVLSGRRLRRALCRRAILRSDQGRRRHRRHGGHTAQAGHEPRRSSRDQSEGHGAGRRRHPQIRRRRLRHLRHQPARRDGVGAAEILRPAGEHGGRHGRRARLLALPLLPRAGVQRLGGGRDRLRARRPRRHHGAARALFRRRRYPLAGPRENGLDHGEAAGCDRAAHARRRRRDRRPPEDRLGLLRARRLGDRDGGDPI